MKDSETPHELLAHASRLLARAWNEYLAELEISYAGYIALSAAAATPSPHQTALAQALYVTSPTMGDTLDRLEQQGHVTSYRRPGDSRFRMIHITARGRNALRRSQEIERSLLAGAEDLRVQLLQLLPRLMNQANPRGRAR